MNNNGIPRQIFLMIDGLLVWLSFLLLANFRDPIRVFLGQPALEQDTLSGLSVVMAIAILMIPLTLEALGYYHYFTRYRQNFLRLLKAVFISVVVLCIYMVATRVFTDSRLFILGLPLVLVALLGIRSRIVHEYLKRKHVNDALKQSVQVFGSAEASREFVASVGDARRAQWDLKEPVELESLQTEALIELLKERSVATAVFLADKTSFNKVSAALELCESMGVEAMLVSDFLRTKLSQTDIEQVGGRTMITLRSTPSISYGMLAKKALDRIGALILIVATLPLWIVAAIGIRLKSPSGPVFFKQQRAGRYGRPFTMWKFRTMHTDAEAQLAKVKAEVGNQMDGPVFKLDNDPRVFGFGSLLRKTSIDELPQLINVLQGEISLVGPRPLPLYEVEEFQKSEHRRRLSVKPGITCFWQAGGRNTITSFEEWVEMDLRYIDNWSFWLDIKILLMTVPAVLFSRGAK